MRFSLNYWAFVFPNAGLTIALIQIANVLASPAIKAVTSAMTVILVVVWLVVAFLHIKAVLRGEVLWPGLDEDLEDMEGHPQEDGEA
jgi:tellurite resistance protein TehA-like permease